MLTPPSPPNVHNSNLITENEANIKSRKQINKNVKNKPR